MLKTWLELHCRQIGLDSSRPWTGSRQHQRKTRSLKSSFPQKPLFVECMSPPSPFLKSYNILKPSKIINTRKESQSQNVSSIFDQTKTMLERLKPASHKNTCFSKPSKEKLQGYLIQIYLPSRLDIWDLASNTLSSFLFAIRMALVYQKQTTDLTMIADENVAKHNDDNNKCEWSQVPLNSYNINH